MNQTYIISMSTCSSALIVTLYFSQGNLSGSGGSILLNIFRMVSEGTGWHRKLFLFSAISSGHFKNTSANPVLSSLKQNSDNLNTIFGYKETRILFSVVVVVLRRAIVGEPLTTTRLQCTQQSDSVHVCAAPYPWSMSATPWSMSAAS